MKSPGFRICGQFRYSQNSHGFYQARIVHDVLSLPCRFKIEAEPRDNEHHPESVYLIFPGLALAKMAIDAPRPLKLVAVDGEFRWLFGAGTPFLESLPRWPGSAQRHLS